MAGTPAFRQFAPAGSPFHPLRCSASSSSLAILPRRFALAVPPCESFILSVDVSVVLLVLLVRRRCSSSSSTVVLRSSFFVIRYSLFVIRSSFFVIRYSLFVIRYSLFVIRYSFLCIVRCHQSSSFVRCFRAAAAAAAAAAVFVVFARSRASSCVLVRHSLRLLRSIRSFAPSFLPSLLPSFVASWLRSRGRCRRGHQYKK